MTDRPDQSYYWTPGWQEDEQAAVAEVERGEARTFDSVADAVEWLRGGSE